MILESACRSTVSWSNKSIVVNSRVRIDMPYTDDFFFPLQSDVMDTEMGYLKKLVGQSHHP